MTETLELNEGNESLSRFLSFWQRVGAKGNGRNVFSSLAAQYSERHRAYHNLTHINAMLDEFEQVRHLASNQDAIESAVWYHDAVYDTRAKDNEEQSAVLASHVLRSAGLSEDFNQLVNKLILATKHSAEPIELDTQLLVDIDLSILGQPEHVFDKYEENIRKEYEWVPDDAFKAGRSTVLQQFLNREFIYSTEFFRGKYEVQARKNITRSLEQLANI